MKVLKTINDIQRELKPLWEKNSNLGFVPTMGALHAGHLSLVEKSTKQNNCTVVSIFVNPTQFNNKMDLKSYPRELEADLNKLKETNVNFVFVPDENEMYPEPDNRMFDFGNLGETMEGKHRPGHFNGVAQIVSKLFDIVKPTRAYFGLKDFQQLAIIKRLVKDYSIKVEIVPCDILRENDGLAMSSRNALLSGRHRKNAPLISDTLFKSVNLANKETPAELKKWVISRVNQNKYLNTEYFDIVNAENLQSIENWEECETAVGCIAVFAGDVRLIDNVLYKK